MKNIIKLFTALFFTAFIITGCDDILEVDSDRILLEENHAINHPYGAIYGTTGVFSKLEKLAQRYVLLGELRGEMMDITDNANMHLREISEFNISPDNPYADIRDYYAVINQCNYVIHKLDTSVVIQAEQVLIRDLAAVKAIRAWTYLQAALNYGSVRYFEEPLLTVEAAQTDFPVMTLNELLPVLIADLEPLRTIQKPEAVNIVDNITSTYLYFPVRFVLGDLYLWNGEYERAALEYRNLMVEEQLPAFVIRNTWNVSGTAFIGRIWGWWNGLEVTNVNRERITIITRSLDEGQGAFLDSIMFYNYEVAPSPVSIETFESQVYYHNANVSNEGDLRGPTGETYRLYDELSGFVLPPMYSNISGDYITKYLNYSSTESSSSIYLYRVAQLHLRYAEAVNRAGKPNLAFSVIKHGLKEQVVLDDSIVPIRERPDPIPTYMDFSNPFFNFSRGIRERGSGNLNLVDAFRIPALPTLQDSIQYVEDMIIEEYALELGFEGHRFHDLMRVAKRRNDPGYLATIVGRRDQSLVGVLMDENRWYLPKK